MSQCGEHTGHLLTYEQELKKIPIAPYRISHIKVTIVRILPKRQEITCSPARFPVVALVHSTRAVFLL